MLRRTAVAAIVYAIACVVFTWPLVLHPRALFGAMDPAGDPSLNLWTLGWDLQTLSTHPLWLATGRVFRADIFFPATDTLAYSDHLLLQAAVVWPIYRLTHDLILCYNVLLLVSLVASALAMHLLVRTLVESDAAAYVAGLIFGFAPYHFTHLVHIQLQALYFLPLSFLLLHRLFGDRRRSDTIGLGIVMGLQTVSSVYYGVIGAIGVAVAAVFLLVTMRRIGDWRLIRRGLSAAALGLLIAAPWSIPYLRVAGNAGGGRTLYEATNGSAVLSSYVQAPPTNRLYGRTGWLRPESSLMSFKDGPEQGLFMGVVALALAAIGMFAAMPGQKRTAALYAGLALVGLILSLGPDGWRSLYALLYDRLFGMAAIRAPARFSVLVLLGVAVLAALGIRRLEAARPQPVLGVTLLLLIGVEYFNGVIAFPSPPPLMSNAGRWLATQPGRGAVLCAPMGPFATNTPCMLQALEHGRPIVNGYSGLRPPFFEALIDAANRLPAPDSLLTLHDLGVEFVVSASPLPLDAGSSQVLLERASFPDARIYQLAWSPEVDATLSAVTDTPPPEPGPPPFEAGESATYRVRWTSGPATLPAGDASIAVAPPKGSERYRFLVSAKTAPWMSRFYEADASLETTTDDRLLPLMYRETIADGKRRIEREAVFDRSRREVALTSGGNALTLPLGKDARDPIAALFYLRTLPLTPALHVTLPLSDNGRRSALNVDVLDPLERVVIDGREWSAWKLSVEQSDRLGRRRPLKISAWISADERRLPLIVEVDAAFGSARLELTNYRPR